MDAKVNLADSLERFDDVWGPRIVAELNDYKVQVVKVRGEFVWHRHADTDELFFVLSGQMEIQLRGRIVCLGPGELFVVARGEEHCPRSEAGAEILLIEPMGTVNTGDAGGPLTAVERRIGDTTEDALTPRRLRRGG
jgi:mannose-6-phosphate isomerase-like protein (cupin superfamily)